MGKFEKLKAVSGQWPETGDTKFSLSISDSPYSNSIWLEVSVIGGAHFISIDIDDWRELVNVGEALITAAKAIRDAESGNE